MQARFMFMVILLAVCTQMACQMQCLEDRVVHCTRAQEVIARNLEAIGGAERIRAVDSLAIQCSFGSAILLTSDEMTLCLKKPDQLKLEGAFRITLVNGKRAVFNNCGNKKVLSGGALDGVLFRMGFYQNCFSLLKWEDHFPEAQLEGIKKYGNTEHYMIRFPGAEAGRDLLAYVDAETFLVDRIVHRVEEREVGELQEVYQLRDYKEFNGIRLPTRVVIDKVGWETAPNQILIQEVAFNPGFAEDLFDSSDIDFGKVVCEAGRIEGEVLAYKDGYLLTNIQAKDLKKAGVPFKDWMTLEAGGVTLPIRVLDNIQMSAAEIKPGEVYLTRYPISGFSRFMLMGWSMDVRLKIPCQAGDKLVFTAMDKEPDHEG